VDEESDVAEAEAEIVDVSAERSFEGDLAVRMN
jgi:hypothetical protein